MEEKKKLQEYDANEAMRGVHPRTRDKLGSLKSLAARGLTPAVMLDVGAHLYGTPDFYDVHPNAKHILFEPVEEFHPNLLEICKQYEDMEVVICAVSNYIGKTTLELTDGLSHSNINTGYLQSANKSLTRNIEVTTLDHFLRQRNIEGPYWLKVDVDGFDEQVIQGATETLKNTDVVIFEADVDNVSFRLRFMEERGFFLWDLVELHYHTDSLYFFDMIFLPERYRSAKFRDWVS